jgi:hypothetical protein
VLPFIGFVLAPVVFLAAFFAGGEPFAAVLAGAAVPAFAPRPEAAAFFAGRFRGTTAFFVFVAGPDAVFAVLLREVATSLELLTFFAGRFPATAFLVGRFCGTAFLAGFFRETVLFVFFAGPRAVFVVSPFGVATSLRLPTVFTRFRATAFFAGVAGPVESSGAETAFAPREDALCFAGGVAGLCFWGFASAASTSGVSRSGGDPSTTCLTRSPTARPADATWTNPVCATCRALMAAIPTDMPPRPAAFTETSRRKYEGRKTLLLLSIPPTAAWALRTGYPIPGSLTRCDGQPSVGVRGWGGLSGAFALPIAAACRR